MNLNTQPLFDALSVIGTPEKSAVLSRFFKTGKGQYGEGDRFLGVPVPETRKIAKAHANLSFSQIQKNLESPWHEVRLCALLILVLRFQKTKDSQVRRNIFDFYLKNAHSCNNWDLVDLTAPTIVGETLAIETPTTRRALLRELSESENLWRQRIAIVSTLTLIRQGEFTGTLALVKKMSSHPHDLIRKALGWMLREIGKRDRSTLTQFLEKHVSNLSRTTLRYAIEHYSPDERKQFLARPKQL